MFKDDLERRMAYAVRRASRAMAVTSSTTSVAFLANFASPMLPIRAFGIFAGVMVPVNFFLTIVVFPPSVLIYDKYIHGSFHNLFCLVCCCRKRKIDAIEEITE